MSKFNLLSAAIVLAVAAAAPAHAYTVDTAAPYVANVDVTDATTVVTTAPLNVTLTGQDLIIGRTVGFSLRITLQDGAEFATAVTSPSLGTAGSAASTWTPTVAAGGAVGDEYVIILFTPAATPSPVTTGDLFSAGLSFDLDNVAALGTVGSTVRADVMFADPGTAAPIMSPSVVQTILRSVNPLLFAVAGGDTAKKIDVGTGNGNSKTTFSINGNINSAPGNTAQHFNAGALSIGVTSHGTPAVPTVDASGSAFAWAASDLVDLALTGNFSAFKTTTPANGARVILTGAGTCSVAATPVANGTGVVTDTTVTFTGVAATDAHTAELCFIAPTVASGVVIDASHLNSVTATVSRATKSAVGTDSFLPFLYNGPVVDVYHFNPASNPDQQSYLRITNPSSTAGRASVVAVCDNGVQKPATDFVVPAGSSLQVTSQDLENGNAAKGIATGVGACPTSGKSRLTVTGEFIGMQVQNFLRNRTGDAVINTNINNQD